MFPSRLYGDAGCSPCVRFPTCCHVRFPYLYLRILCQPVIVTVVPLSVVGDNELFFPSVNYPWSAVFSNFFLFFTRPPQAHLSGKKPPHTTSTVPSQLLNCPPVLRGTEVLLVESSRFLPDEVLLGAEPPELVDLWKVFCTYRFSSAANFFCLLPITTVIINHICLYIQNSTWYIFLFNYVLFSQHVL